MACPGMEVSDSQSLYGNSFWELHLPHQLSIALSDLFFFFPFQIVSHDQSGDFIPFLVCFLLGKHLDATRFVAPFPFAYFPG